MRKADAFQVQLRSNAMDRLSAQALSHRVMLESPAVRRHAGAIAKAIEAVRAALVDGNFETLMELEKGMQQLELTIYSRDPGMVAGIEKTRGDLDAGLLDYRQLTEDPESYRARGYRPRDRTGPNRRFPLDTMRKALRSQATRVGNFAKNPMLGPEEKEFHSLRVSVLKRAEALYEEMQAQSLNIGDADYFK